MKAIKWTNHAATTVVEDDPSVVTGKRIIAECDTEEHAALFAAAEDMEEMLRRLMRNYGHVMNADDRKAVGAVLAKARP